MNFLRILVFVLFYVNLNILQCKSSEDEQDESSLNNQLVHVRTVEDDEIQRVDNIYVSDDEFVPTSEWQTVKKDQGIPRGLHVRLNIQTGEREAKLLDETPQPNQNEQTNKNYVKTKEKYEKLKESLKQLNDELVGKNFDDLSLKENVEVDAEREKEIKQKFRSYEELKQDLEKLNLNIRTDAELITMLIYQFNSTTDKNEKLKILGDFEYYVHQFDNGVLLCDLGGFDLIVNELNTTDDINIKLETALVLGSALQSNPKVKIHSIKSELLHLILNQLSKIHTNSDLLSQNLISRYIFTLSGMLRNFPFAQSQFIRFGGVEVLNKILAKEFYPTKLKTKILTLTKDLILEKFDATNIINYDPGSLSKYQQYLKVELIDKLMETNWCDNFESLLDNTNDHDTNEKLVDSIWNMITYCKFSTKTSLVNKLEILKVKYLDLSLEDSSSSNEDNYFLKISNDLNKILEFIKKENINKSEL